MNKPFTVHKVQFGLAGLTMGVLLLLFALTLSQPTSAAAAPNAQGNQPSNETCLFCHKEEGMTVDIGGHPLPLTIDGALFEASVHGTENIACVDCHTNITSFPHPEVTASDPRDFSLKL